MKEIDFCEIVKVVDTESTRRWNIAGKEAVVVGKVRKDDEEDGEVVGYSVSLADEGSYSVDADEIVPTGRRVRREDIYTGESIRVSPTGEYLGPGSRAAGPEDK